MFVQAVITSRTADRNEARAEVAASVYSFPKIISILSNFHIHRHSEHNWKRCHLNFAKIVKWPHFNAEATDGSRSLRSLWRIACEIVIDLEGERPFKKLPLRPWLWMTFFFAVA